MFLFILLAILSLASLTPYVYADTLRVCTYNALNFRGAADADRYDDFRVIFRGIDADIVALQEIISADAVSGLLSNVFSQVRSDWAAAPFVNGYDTDNALVYRTSQVAFISQRAIHTQLRDITEYLLRPAAPADTSLRLRIYSLHLKASQGTENEIRRRDEAALLRAQLDVLPAGSLFFVCGDYNVYTSDEPAYQLLLSSSPNVNGQCFDPINRPGDWNNNSAFAAIHTQSPDASYGGMDDRFDILLVSGGLMDPAGSRVLPETYTPYGNDGRHFNNSINAGTNYAVPDSVADALFNGSDHLPVFVDIILQSESSSAGETSVIPENPGLIRCYPNPFNSTLTVEIAPLRQASTLDVFDLLGRRVYEMRVPTGAVSPLRLDFSAFGTGPYWIQLHTPTATHVARVLLVR